MGKLTNSLDIYLGRTELKKDTLFNPILDHIEETGNMPSFQDYYGNLPTPGSLGLIKQYKNIVYACANINANSVATNKLKLFVKTTKNEPQTILKTAPVEKEAKAYLQEQFKITENIQIDEVVEHPILDLLNKPYGDSPYLNEFKLLRLTQLYQEITGAAYWWIIKNPVFGIPNKIFLFPSQHLRPIREIGSNQLVDYYEYCGPDNEFFNKKFSPDEIIPFLAHSLYDPYTEGFSPGMASFDQSLVIDKLMSMTNKFLDNQARPDVLISPKEAIGADIAERWERQLGIKFKQGKGGGWHVLDEPANVEVLNFKPNDYARLDLQSKAKEIICNIFDVPLALLDSAAISEKTLEAAMKQHAIYGVSPRIKSNADLLTAFFIPMYDKSKRLFIGYDDPVPENRSEKLQENVQLVMNGIKTANEARKTYNLPPHPQGDELRPINVAGSGAEQRQNTRESGSAEK